MRPDARNSFLTTSADDHQVRAILKRYTSNTVRHTCMQQGGFDDHIAAARLFESLGDRLRGNLFAALARRLDVQQVQLRSVGVGQITSGFEDGMRLGIQLYRADDRPEAIG